MLRHAVLVVALACACAPQRPYVYQAPAPSPPVTCEETAAGAESSARRAALAKTANLRRIRTSAAARLHAHAAQCFKTRGDASTAVREEEKAVSYYQELCPFGLDAAPPIFKKYCRLLAQESASLASWRSDATASASALGPSPAPRPAADQTKNDDKMNSFLELSKSLEKEHASGSDQDSGAEEEGE